MKIQNLRKLTFFSINSHASTRTTLLAKTQLGFKTAKRAIGRSILISILMPLLIAGLWLTGIGHATAWAAPAVALSQQTPVEVAVELGTTSGELRFVPNQLTFEAGKRYKLRLSNNSPTKHYFTAKDFADAIWSQKVDAGNVEVKGAIHELELRPNTVADWVFVPVRSGKYTLRCTVPGHQAAGMTGEILIQ